MAKACGRDTLTRSRLYLGRTLRPQCHAEVAQGGPSPAEANRTRVERDARERLALPVTMAAHVTSARDATRRIDHLIGAAQVLSVSEDSAARTPKRRRHRNLAQWRHDHRSIGLRIGAGAT